MTDDTAIRTIGRGRVDATVAAMTESPSRLDDPQWRTDRARKAAATRAGADYHIRKLAELRAELTPEQVDALAELAHPATAHVALAKTRDLEKRVARAEEWVAHVARHLGMAL